MTATLTRKQHDARVLATLEKLAGTDHEIVEVLRVISVGLETSVQRVIALEKASEEQRNLLAGAVDMVNAMRGVLDLFSGGIATLERRIIALEQAQAQAPNGDRQFEKRGFDA